MAGRLQGMGQLLQELDEAPGRLLRALTLEALGRLILRTPVKTGRAQNNWNVGISRPNTATDDLEAYPEGGQLALARGTPVAGVARAGDTVFITNALPYIQPLEDGSSTQAPKGMIAVTVAELQNVTDAIVRKVRRSS